MEIDFATNFLDKNNEPTGGSASGMGKDNKPEDKPEIAENLMEKIAHFFADKLHLSSSTDDDDADGRHVLQSGQLKLF